MEQAKEIPPVQDMDDLRARIAALPIEDDRWQANRFIRSANLGAAARFVLLCQSRALGGK